MAKNKLKKFAQNLITDNLLQPGKEQFETIKGNWNKDFFKNQQPIVLELGCGGGEYSIGLAKEYPNKNFIGIDIKGARLNKGSQDAINENLNNVGFLRIRIHEIEHFFAENEIDELWVTFPDPRPRDRDIKRRLTSPKNLDRYRKILKKDGILNLKTDSYELYIFTKEVITEQKLNLFIDTDNLYESEFVDLHKGIKTKYEEMFLKEGKKINYLKFSL